MRSISFKWDYGNVLITILFISFYYENYELIVRFIIIIYLCNECFVHYDNHNLILGFIMLSNTHSLVLGCIMCYDKQDKINILNNIHILNFLHLKLNNYIHY